MNGIPERLTAALADRYRIEREIGAGGMATVYLAEDLKHHRKVALKVLRPELGAVLGTDRFLSEINVTANLQHPHLLPLFDSGEANGLLFYVMPYIEGESLRHLLERERQLPVDDAVRIATSVASALDYAHRHGVIHRDLKPENILLHEGQPLVTDFGIALAISNAGGARVTQTGLSLGTPQYMSPEQATGDRVIDARSDIYSLAAVLYEMLAGDPPHAAGTTQAIIAKILTEKPASVRTYRESVPEHVDAAIQVALGKLPADRFASASEFAQAITGRIAVPHATTAARDGRVEHGSRVSRVALYATPVLAAALLGVGYYARPDAAPAPITRFVITMPDSVPMQTLGDGPHLALSPDGRTLVYVAGAGPGMLYRRTLDAVDATPIPGTEGARRPQFSPDGEWLAFVVGTTLQRMPAGGGTATVIGGGVRKYSLSADGRIVFTRFASNRANSGLWMYEAAGGEPVQFTRTDSASEVSAHTSPVLLPGGDVVVFSLQRGREAAATLAALRIGEGDIVDLGISGMAPLFSSSGHIVYADHDGVIRAVPFDSRSLRVTGTPVVLITDITTDYRIDGTAQFALSPGGTLAYIEGKQATELALIGMDGAERVLPMPRGYYGWLRFSPDGRRIAVSVSEGVAGGESNDVAIYDLETATLSRLMRDGTSERPEWMPDGRVAYVAFDSVAAARRDSRSIATHGGQNWARVLAQPRDRSEAPIELLPAGAGAWALAFTPAGELMYMASGGINVSPRDSALRQLLPGVLPAGKPAVSPDGGWLAYYESGNVHVQRLTTRGGRYQVSHDGGDGPVWSPDSRRIYYRTGARSPSVGSYVVAADMSTTPEFRVVRHDTLFFEQFIRSGANRMYDIAPDGTQFVMLRPDVRHHRIIVVLNWLDELRARARPGARATTAEATSR